MFSWYKNIIFDNRIITHYKCVGFTYFEFSCYEMFWPFEHFCYLSFLSPLEVLDLKSYFISLKGIKFFGFMGEVSFFFSSFFIHCIYKTKGSLSLFINSNELCIMISFLYLFTKFIFGHIFFRSRFVKGLLFTFFLFTLKISSWFVWHKNSL